MSNTNFEVPMFKEDNVKDAVESAAKIVKDVPAKSFLGNISGKGVIGLAAVGIIGLAAVGVAVWKKCKPEEEIRMPDADAPVELSTEELAELSTAE